MRCCFWKGGVLFKITISMLILAGGPSEHRYAPVTQDLSRFWSKCLWFTEEIENNQVGSALAGDTHAVVHTEDDVGADINHTTTSFTADADTTMAKLTDPYSLDQRLVASASTSLMQDIIAFLAKPYPLYTGTLASTDTSSTFSPFDLFAPLLSKDIYYQKVKGHMGIRADVCLRLQVNANRFQQGRYILAFLPTVGADQTFQNTINQVIKYRFNPTTVTQLPHVELDIGSETEAILEIKYVNALTHYLLYTNNSSKGVGSPGYGMLYPYNSLASAGGSSTATYTLWISYHNVKFAAPMIPQSNIIYEYQAGGEPKDTRFNTRRYTPIEREQFSKNTGPVGSVFAAASGLSSAVGTYVPFLSAITAPVAWATDIVANICGAFGWGNPINLAEVTRALQTVYPYAANCDNIDSSMPLSGFSRNELEILPGFAATDRDEMCIDFVKSVNAWYTTFTLSTSDTVGQNYLFQGLAPLFFNNAYTHGTASLIAETPVSFLGKLFGLYRGGFRLTFKVVKTEFHSGRLAVVFLPTDIAASGTISTPSLADTSYLHREVIDLRAGNEFSFDFPYTSVAAYRSTTTNEQRYGYAGVYCLNPLIAPATVPSTVKVLVEVSGSPDLEFAQLKDNTLTPVMPYTFQGVFDYKPSSKVIATGEIGNSKVMGSALMPARTCIGEKFNSLLQVGKCATDMANVNVTATTSGYQFDPYELSVLESQVAGGFKKPYNGSETAALIRSCYALERGGMRWRMRVPAASAPTTSYTPYSTALLYVDPQAAGYVGMGFTATQPTGHTLNVAQNVNFVGGVEIQTPPYCKSFARPVFSNYVCAGGSSQIWYDGNLANSMLVQVNTGTSSAVTHTFFRQFSDDYQAGLFVGVPILGTYT